MCPRVGGAGGGRGRVQLKGDGFNPKTRNREKRWAIAGYKPGGRLRQRVGQLLPGFVGHQTQGSEL